MATPWPKRRRTESGEIAPKKTHGSAVTMRGRREYAKGRWHRYAVTRGVPYARGAMSPPTSRFAAGPRSVACPRHGWPSSWTHWKTDPLYRGILDEILRPCGDALDSSDRPELIRVEEWAPVSSRQPASNARLREVWLLDDDGARSVALLRREVRTIRGRRRGDSSGLAWCASGSSRTGVRSISSASSARRSAAKCFSRSLGTGTISAGSLRPRAHGVIRALAPTVSPWGSLDGDLMVLTPPLTRHRRGLAAPGSASGGRGGRSATARCTSA